ncbi:bL35 family ribosomal protein [Candidatus Hodgkinia cicadicola]
MTHKLKKYKLKTKSAFKKRFKLLRSGKVKAYCAGNRHRLYRDSGSSKQRLRAFFLCKADAAAVKRFLYR